MQLLSFRTDFTDKRRLDDLISYATKGPFCHSELRFSPRLCEKVGRPVDTCFSSTMQDDPKFGRGGSRFKVIHTSHPERWDILDLPVPEDEEMELYQWCVRHDQMPYNWAGAILSARPWLKWLGVSSDPDKLFCSESVASCLMQWTFLHSELRKKWRKMCNCGKVQIHPVALRKDILQFYNK